MRFNNITLVRNGQTYRVCINDSDYAMGVFRKTKTGRETALDMDGPTGRMLLAEARKKRDAQIG